MRVVAILLGMLWADGEGSAVGAEHDGKTSPPSVAANPNLRRPCGVAHTEACLVLTYEFQPSLSREHDVWFVDSLGRLFSYSLSREEDARTSVASCRDPLAEARGGGSVGPRDFAALLALSHPLGPPLPRAEVNHLLTLVHESRAIRTEEKGTARCKDDSKIEIWGYWSAPDGHASSSFLIRSESTCGDLVVYNPSPAAQELVQWVHEHAGKTVPAWSSPNDPKPTRGADMGPHEVAEYVKRHLPQVKACHQRALETNPKLSGKVVIHWTIDAHGATRNVGVESNTMEASSTPACLQTLIKKWRFVKPCRNVEVSFPFVFQPL